LNSNLYMKKQDKPTMTSKLNDPEPIMIFIDMSFLAKNTPNMLVNSSIIDELAANKVTLATC
jgi:hypothetical protein